MSWMPGKGLQTVENTDLFSKNFESVTNFCFFGLLTFQEEVLRTFFLILLLLPGCASTKRSIFLGASGEWINPSRIEKMEQVDQKRFFI